MDRRDRERNDYGLDYSRYDGYSRDDEHYHSARNLTDEFERDYRRHEGRWDDRDRYNRNRTYHEGDMGDAYERMSREGRGAYRESGNQWGDRDRNWGYSGNFNRDRDRYSNYQDDYRNYQGMDRRDRDRNQEQHGNRRQGYLMSYYDGTFGRYDDLEGDNNRRGTGDNRSYYSKSGYGDRKYAGYGQRDDNAYGYRNRDNWRRDDSYRNDSDWY